MKKIFATILLVASLLSFFTSNAMADARYCGLEEYQIRNIVYVSAWTCLSPETYKKDGKALDKPLDDLVPHTGSSGIAVGRVIRGCLNPKLIKHGLAPLYYTLKELNTVTTWTLNTFMSKVSIHSALACRK